MAKPIILSHYTYDFKKTHKEKPTGVSKTLDQDTMSIQDIIKRQASGLVDLERNSIYIDAELDHIDKFHGQALDLTDLDELQERLVSLNEFVNQTRTELEKDQEEPEISEGADAGGDDNQSGDDVSSE